MKLLKKPDIYLILGLFVIGGILCAYNFLNGKQGSTVEIQISGETVKTLSLDENQEYLIKSEKGENTLVIDHGEAYIKDASCPDGLCEKMGKINKNGQSIICLPNEVVVVVIDTDSDNLDVVVGG